jgi:hypothetical protein
MKGLIFIPDISGYTNFVNSVPIGLGVKIVKDLLNVIIQANPLKITLSEIEGDAMLYYKPGEPLPPKDLFEGFKKISEAFDARYKHLKAKYKLTADLCLKVIVHYGELKLYNVFGFKTLYGEAVIESHRLLKNGEGCTNYILITEDYFDSVKGKPLVNKIHQPDFSHNFTRFFTGLRKISYYLYSNLPIEKNEPSYSFT